MTNLGIGKLAALSGIKIPTIRFYEKINLLDLPPRTEGGQRRYDESALHRLHFIRHARELDLSVRDIRQLLTVYQDPMTSCAPVKGITRRHLQKIEGEIARLKLIRSELRRMMEACPGHVSVSCCRILESIVHPRAAKRNAFAKGPPIPAFSSGEKAFRQDARKPVL